MSSSKGNIKRTRPQKHQNRTAFKNDLHDKSVKIKFINSIQPSGICLRCKDIIAWKIKYKKYKPLTAPKKCVRCEQKSVKHAYHVICLVCSRAEKICAKCLKHEEVIEAEDSSSKNQDEFQNIIKALPERKRRTLLRYMKKQSEGVKKNKEENPEDEEKQAHLTEKINKLKLEAQNENIDDYDSDFIDSESDCSNDDNEDVSDDSECSH